MADLGPEAPVELDPAIRAHLRKIASPAHVAIAASNGQWQPVKHLMVLNRIFLDAVLDPEQSFLNVQAAVRHGKSELLSKWAIVWYLGVMPGKRVLLVSATATLAEKFSREVRDIFKEWGPALFGKSVRTDLSAVGEWGTTDGGTVFAVGVGGQITGLGFDLVVIDDPIKDAEQAASETVKAKQVEWYSGTLRSRLMPGGTMVLTMARWADDDLSAVIVEKAVESDLETDPWVVVSMPAIAEAPPGEDPETWRDWLGRADGEALWPELWPTSLLLRIKASMPNPEYFDALYQQDPIPKTGNLFPKEAWPEIRLDRRVRCIGKVRAWDLAGTNGAGDWTVGVLMGKLAGARGATVVLDVFRDRLSADGVERAVLECATIDGPDVKIRMETPKGDAGVTAHHYSTLLPHRDFDGWSVKQDKAARADIMSSAQRRGLISLVDAVWVNAYIGELARFPRGKHDDQVDASSLAYNTLWDLGEAQIELPDAQITLNRGARPQQAERPARLQLVRDVAGQTA